MWGVEPWSQTNCGVILWFGLKRGLYWNGDELGWYNDAGLNPALTIALVPKFLQANCKQPRLQLWIDDAWQISVTWAVLSLSFVSVLIVPYMVNLRWPIAWSHPWDVNRAMILWIYCWPEICVAIKNPHLLPLLKVKVKKDPGALPLSGYLLNFKTLF